jgi:hypothetical protein
MLATHGVCGRPDERAELRAAALASAKSAALASGARRPLKEREPESLVLARAVAAQMPRCGAFARTTGLPCQRLPLRGKARCRLHGGRSTGARPVHGGRSRDAERMQHYLLALLGALRATQTKPAPVDRPTETPTTDPLDRG